MALNLTFHCEILYFEKNKFMKNFPFLLALFAGLFCFTPNQSEEKARTIPVVTVKKLDGSAFSTLNLQKDGTLMLIDFLCTGFSPSKVDLTLL